jgi:hypothetical protein
MRWLTILLCSLLVFSGCKRGESMTGTGTALDPYIITTRADLEAVNDHLDAYYELGADIDLAGSDWTPIAWNAANTDYSASVVFTGSFDGKNHRIRNMTIHTPATDDWHNYGLFSTVTGTIKNVAVCNATIHLRSATSNGWNYNVGLLCGFGLGSVTITGCSVAGSIEKDGNGYVGFVGGIIGYWYCLDVDTPFGSLYISNCRATLSVTAINTTAANRGYEAVGGIGGYLGSYEDANIVVADCESVFTAFGGTTGYIAFSGGLLGWIFTGTFTEHTGLIHVLGCKTSVELNADLDWADCLNGGLIGFIQSESHISDCYAAGKVSGGYIVGGLIGEISGILDHPSIIERCGADVDVHGVDKQLGGFIGAVNAATFTDCYALGSVEATTLASDQNVGGFAGQIYATPAPNVSCTNCYATGVVTVPSGATHVGGFNGEALTSVTNCFWDTQTSGQSRGVDGTGKTTAEMQTQSTFVGWDFSTVWNIASGVYPFLRTAFVTLTDGCSVVRSFPWVFKFCLTHQKV